MWAYWCLPVLVLWVVELSLPDELPVALGACVEHHILLHQGQDNGTECSRHSSRRSRKHQATIITQVAPAQTAGGTRTRLQLQLKTTVISLMMLSGRTLAAESSLLAVVPHIACRRATEPLHLQLPVYALSCSTHLTMPVQVSISRFQWCRVVSGATTMKGLATPPYCRSQAITEMD